MKIILITFKVLSIVCIAVFLLAASLAWGFNSQWLYEYGFSKYDVADSTGLNENNLSIAASSLIHYFNDNAEYIHINIEQNGKSFELFTEEEQIHFKDVKNLVRIDYLAGLISLFVIVIYILINFIYKKHNYRKNFFQTLGLGSIVSLCVILVIIIGSMINFDQFFIQFHYLFFTNSYWSAPGYMLLLFPGGFWFDAAIICFSFMAFWSIVIGIVSLIYVLKNNDKHSIFHISK